MVAGTLEVSDQTEILTAVQSHLVVGNENPDGTIIVSTILTSEKGMKAGIANFTITEKLSETQPISGQEKGQYARSVIPPITVKQQDFILNTTATEYINNPDIKEKLQTMQKISDRYIPVEYDRKGITTEILENIKDSNQHLIKNISNHEHNFEEVD